MRHNFLIKCKRTNKKESFSIKNRYILIAIFLNFFITVKSIQCLAIVILTIFEILNILSINNSIKQNSNEFYTKSN